MQACPPTLGHGVVGPLWSWVPTVCQAESQELGCRHLHPRDTLVQGLQAVPGHDLGCSQRGGDRKHSGLGVHKGLLEGGVSAES